MDRRQFLSLSAASIALSACGGSDSAAPATPLPSVPPVQSVLPESEWQRLAGEMTGDLVLPTQGNDYERARVVFNARFDDIYPQAIAKCHSEIDVQTALAFAQENNMQITPRCSGHAYSGHSTSEGLIIDVTPMDSITVNNTNNTATIGAGARMVDIYDQLSNQGVGIPLGSCLSVGISGLTLGGGLSIVDRAYGLTCDNLVSADVVLADGTQVTCNENQETDLFWALRGGGGGNFGVVTSFTFTTHATNDITVFEAYYSFDDFEEVMAVWQTLRDIWPKEMWVQIIPNWLSGSTTVYIRAFCVNTAEEASPYWDEFINSISATPRSNNTSTNTYRDVMLGNCSNTIAACHLSVQFADGTMPRSAFAASSDFFDQTVPPIGVITLKTFIEDSINNGDRGMIICNMHGGVINEKSSDETAFYHRNSIFSTQYYTALSTSASDESVDSAQAWENSFRTVMAPWSSGGAYVNYTDPLIEDWQQAYYGDNYSRLVMIKNQYDPRGIFKKQQGVELA
jgi:FAD/FMN-containing dehydrogenase